MQVLPAGSPVRGFNVTLVVGVQDSLGAEAFANASVVVQVTSMAHSCTPCGESRLQL